jgi:hypothetical protein
MRLLMFCLIPAVDIGLRVRVPFKKAHEVRLLTADEPPAPGLIPFTAGLDHGETVVEFKIEHLMVSTIAVIK